jgi:molybdate-binding protein
MNTSATRRFLLGAMLAAPSLARAAWPDRPIRLVVPFGGGGQTDIVSRVTAEALSARLGQPVLADNRPGGNGNLAAETVARAAPDGYTVLVAGAGTNSGLNALLYRGITYDAERDFAAVGMFCTTANMLIVHNSIPGEDFAVVSFARWEEGFVVAPGNPKGIRKAEDLARRGVRLVNRETGSGSRALLDRLLQAAGVPAGKVSGYDRLGYGHLAVAYLVLTGEADCCVATRSAARTFQLDFVPLQSERYDFVMRRPTLATPAAQVFLDVLQRAALRRKLEVLAGYDTAQTGAILA